MEFYQKGTTPFYETELGWWGTADAESVYITFKEFLKKEHKFLDLGSGDGKIVAIASLFCDQVEGIEIDEQLIQKSNQVKQQLNINAKFAKENFFKINLKNYDVIFINPDQPILALMDKIKQEFKGILIVYNNLHLPNLEPIKILTPHKIPVHIYKIP